MVCGTGPDPSDETMEQFSLVLYQSVEKDIHLFVTKSEFTNWISGWVAWAYLAEGESEC